MTFPFDFGFIPSTRAEDGDPLDVLILMDEPAFPGCLVHTRIIGVLEAEQIEDNESLRNDRLIGVHVGSVDYGNYETWKELPGNLREEIESFFVYYNKCKGRVFKPISWRGPKRAYKLLQKSLSRRSQAA
jgi:inorganic pyrophosphatase